MGWGLSVRWERLRWPNQGIGGELAGNWPAIGRSGEIRTPDPLLPKQGDHSRKPVNARAISFDHLVLFRLRSCVSGAGPRITGAVLFPSARAAFAWNAG